ncbi:glycosyl hydrolase 115 family protein [Sphingomonas sanxanigenens]|uniref:Gylcosyl hydrolase 115 C-terminal domain-containing protein n=1 Tax=Sphingomonas sanxanigenens DSM 19645 = NX02 TaxID=1123269 RepID=W0A1W4_9SPHN|nr:glycosyl hydrolase 115 family protein [Sphingomonas sanxanigenens]AHE51929.1 hypothetical protein NX02_00815 [Sphingomonas sanxanigenens DSM 19645 = NX02]
MRRALLAALAATAPAAMAHAEEAVLFDGVQVAGIVHDGAKPSALAGEMLARDLSALSGKVPVVSDDLARCSELCIVIGTKGSALVRQVAADTGADLTALDDQWERYERVLLRSRRDPARRYLLIAGSDQRGAIWGMVDLGRALGVSAWEWWADVTPRRVDRLAVDGARTLSDPPSVQYRGIFLNDEDWGLQPWAAKTHEPETGDIGPRTYARIFELMWRLKANLIWPAMHDSTRPFYQIPGNAGAARDHAIIVGTSHAEPMMRNNVREWDEAKRGPFNYFTNRPGMLRYWGERAREVKDFETITTIGLRGKHDSAMEGADTPEQALDATARAIADQRALLAKAQGLAADKVPQALTLYKEVLDIYGAGLDVPEDVTLVWPEDNYGYISQLPTPAERARSGGSGVYYHISYWGRPHDYLWLATTHPALIREQMERAWRLDARKLWVVNVGDIKPGEYLTHYFLDLAFDHRLFAQTPRAHLTAWAEAQFGKEQARRIAGILTHYYDLAFERRPEFIGFSQTEPTRPIRIGDYIRTGGDEAQRRIDAYAALAFRTDAVGRTLPEDRRDAWFQLVGYPVHGAADINRRNLSLDLAALHARQGRPTVNALAAAARAAHQRIVADTAAYNAQNGGKWRGMMDMAPRRLPVFAEPPYPRAEIAAKPGCAVDASDLVFVTGKPSRRTLTVSSNGEPRNWSISLDRGITLLTSMGRLDADNGFEQRVIVRYDGAAAITGGMLACGDRSIEVTARLLPAPAPGAPAALDHIVSLSPDDAGMPADGSWEHVPDLGSRGTALRSSLTRPSADTIAGLDPLAWDFSAATAGEAELRIVAIPVHPLTAANGLRLAVRIDDEAPRILDFETHGRSERWKRNVLANSSAETIALGTLAAGAHRVRVYALDPGFLLDRIDVRFDGAPDYYGAPPVK